MVVRDDEPIAGNKRPGAPVHAADSIHQTHLFRIEQLTWSKLHAFVLQIEPGQFADRKHAFIGLERAGEKRNQ
jgi:hypothetical protein